MSLKQYLKRGFRFILQGVPIKNIQASIVTLAPNELLNPNRSLERYLSLYF